MFHAPDRRANLIIAKTKPSSKPFASPLQSLLAEYGLYRGLSLGILYG